MFALSACTMRYIVRTYSWFRPYSHSELVPCLVLEPFPSRYRLYLLTDVSAATDMNIAVKWQNWGVSHGHASETGYGAALTHLVGLCSVFMNGSYSLWHKDYFEIYLFWLAAYTAVIFRLHLSFNPCFWSKSLFRFKGLENTLYEFSTSSSERLGAFQKSWQAAFDGFG